MDEIATTRLAGHLRSDSRRAVRVNHKVIVIRPRELVDRLTRRED